MPHSRILIHFIWTTKKRYPFLTRDKGPVIHSHIKSNAKKKNIFIVEINNYRDHVHCLISLGNEQNPSEIMRLLKGESAFWINRQNLFKIKFGWQDEFYALSVSESGRRNVINYIRNQDDHHSIKTFRQEYEEYLQVLRADLLG